MFDNHARNTVSQAKKFFRWMYFFIERVPSKGLHSSCHRWELVVSVVSNQSIYHCRGTVLVVVTIQLAGLLSDHRMILASMYGRVILWKSVPRPYVCHHLTSIFLTRFKKKKQTHEA